MKIQVISIWCIFLFIAVGSTLPVSQSQDVLSTKETIDTVKIGETTNNNFGTRDKRTIGFLRETFPTISEIIDQKLQAITRFLFRIIGRLVLGGAGGGGTTTTSTTDESSSSDSSSSSAGASSGGAQGRRISITLPTYPPSLDDEEEEEEENNDDSASAASNNDILSAAASTSIIKKTEIPSSTSEGDKSADEVKSRVTRATNNNDQAQASSNDTPTIDQDTDAAEENRDKRFLFGFGGEGGSAGGSGNFLFDIIRGAAEGTGRAAGQFYRAITGTSEDEIPILYPKHYIEPSDSEGGGGGGQGVKKTTEKNTLTISINSPSSTSLQDKSISLIAGSGTTEEEADAGGIKATGYSAGAAAIESPELDNKPGDDGYTSGIPGPITRLFVIANRGISNLIQDLILRLAQTSERVVNFKARLITSII